MKPIVVHVSAEVSPFHKSGGLGDVLSGLPEALARAGLDVRVVTPRYPDATNLASIGGEKSLKPWPVPIDVSLGGNAMEARVFEARTHGGAVTTYFVDAPHLSRGALYGYGDDPYRFAILSRAASPRSSPSTTSRSKARPRRRSRRTSTCRGTPTTRRSRAAA